MEQPLTDNSARSWPRPAAWEWIVLASATVVGAILRIWMLHRAPGLWMDEAYHGLDALAVINEPDGIVDWPLFFSANNGREPLFIYLETLSVYLNGTTVLALRSVSTIIGILTILMVWLAAREWGGARIAAYTVVGFALMRWHVHFSALAFRTILTPMFCCLVMLFFLRFWRRRKLADAALCGVVLGGGFYTYISFRLVPVMLGLLAAVALWEEARRRERLRFLLKPFLALAVAALVVAAPLAWHFAENPGDMGGRSGDISVFKRDDAVALILRQARDVALMPLLRGDHVGKHNIPGAPKFLQMFNPPPQRTVEMWYLDQTASPTPMDPHGTGTPAFDPVTGLLFYFGLAAMIAAVMFSVSASTADPDSDGSYRRARWYPAVPVVWIVVGCAASVFSFGAPNMLRMLIVTPAVAMTLAVAMDQIVVHASHRGRHLAFGIGILLAGVYATTEVRRAATWSTHPSVRQEFNQEWVDIGNYLREQPDRIPVRLFIDAPPTLRYLADGYYFNPRDMDRAGDHWWEFRTEPPFPPLPDPQGEVRTESRRHMITHPTGIRMGELVEVFRPPEAP